MRCCVEILGGRHATEKSEERRRRHIAGRYNATTTTLTWPDLRAWKGRRTRTRSIRSLTNAIPVNRQPAHDGRRMASAAAAAAAGTRRHRLLLPAAAYESCCRCRRLLAHAPARPAACFLGASWIDDSDGIDNSGHRSSSISSTTIGDAGACARAGGAGRGEQVGADRAGGVGQSLPLRARRRGAGGLGHQGGIKRFSLVLLNCGVVKSTCTRAHRLHPPAGRGRGCRAGPAEGVRAAAAPRGPRSRNRRCSGAGALPGRERRRQTDGGGAEPLSGRRRAARQVRG